jgi:hypothetical protein
MALLLSLRRIAYSTGTDKVVLKFNRQLARPAEAGQLIEKI